MVCEFKTKPLNCSAMCRIQSAMADCESVFKAVKAYSCVW